MTTEPASARLLACAAIFFVALAGACGGSTHSDPDRVVETTRSETSSESARTGAGTGTRTVEVTVPAGEMHTVTFSTNSPSVYCPPGESEVECGSTQRARDATSFNIRCADESMEAVECTPADREEARKQAVAELDRKYPETTSSGDPRLLFISPPPPPEPPPTFDEDGVGPGDGAQDPTTDSDDAEEMVGEAASGGDIGEDDGDRVAPPGETSPSDSSGGDGNEEILVEPEDDSPSS